jgi:hypothetical protein
MDLGLPRLRQVALVAADLGATCAAVDAGLGLADPFHDPGVALFGLENAVYEAGDTFLEVVSPVQADATAARYLARRGGDAGYMAIFQVADLSVARQRVQDLGLRTAFELDLDDARSMHLHPKDVPGAIVSLEEVTPPESWRWAGPRWTGGAPDTPHAPSGTIAGLVVRLVDVAASATTWAEVLDVPLDGNEITLANGHQRIRFEPARDEQSEGITTVELTHLAQPATIANVAFTGPQ